MDNIQQYSLLNLSVTPVATAASSKNDEEVIKGVSEAQAAEPDVMTTPESLEQFEQFRSELQADNAAAKETVAATLQANAQQEMESACDDEGNGSTVLGIPADPPKGCFPPPIEKMLTDVSKVFGVTLGIVIGALLALLAVCIGGKRAAAFKRDNPQPAVLWLIISDDSGGGKSPVINFFFKPLRDAIAALMINYKRACIEYEACRDSDTPADERPPKPEMPAKPIVDDVTLEALAMGLEHSPGGVGVVADEFLTVLRGFDAYTGGGAKGRSKSRLLSCYDGGAWDKQRVSGDATTFIPHAYVSMIAGIQTDLLPLAFSGEDLSSGCFGRCTFIRSFNPNMPYWQNESIKQESHDTLDRLMQYLLGLEMEVRNEIHEPVIVEVDPEAIKDVWAPWYNELVRDTWYNHPDKRILLQKQSQQASRLALLVHIAWQAFNDEPSEVISRATLEKSLRLSDWLNGFQREVWDILKKNHPPMQAVNRLYPVDIDVARVVLAHEAEITALPNGSVPNKKLEQWMEDAGLPIRPHAMGQSFRRLEIAPTHSGDRGRVFDDKALASLKQIVQTVQMSKRP